MNKFLSLISDLLSKWGLAESSNHLVATCIAFGVSCLGIAILYPLLSRLVEPIISKVTRRTDYKWDDVLFRHKFLRWVWALLLVLFAYRTLPESLSEYAPAAETVRVILRIGLIMSMMMMTIELVKSVFLLIADRNKIDEIVEQMHSAKARGEEYVYKPSHSLKGLEQMCDIVIIGISVILIISTLIGRDPLIIFSGLGAMAAVLMLIFQDSILGVVAGVQITANDMLKPGDWIISEKYGANGIVQEVTLATVKVRNWDNTTITIPPYRLLTEGFQNWRGMIESRGRRVMRSINIDMTTIRFATEEELLQWREQAWWRESMASGPIVNITAFRMYLDYIIQNVPTIVNRMLYMIRELQPTPQGLPIEMYFFTSETEWKAYELVQADVMDNVIASVADFGLRIFQNPTGRIEMPYKMH